MQATIACFSTEKAGNKSSENEDAYWVGPDGEGGVWDSNKDLHVAVADGTSESFLAGRWAQDLTKKFATATAPGPHDLPSTIASCVRDWEELPGKYRKEREERSKPVQWYEEPGLAHGTYATVVAVRLRDGLLGGPRKGPLEAWALGDACLFQVRNDRLERSFPIRKSDEFGVSPELVQSQPADVNLTRRRVRRADGEWKSGDSLYLATDALSHWFLTQDEAGHRPWEKLSGFTRDRPGAFADWVNGLRGAHLIHNDDTTLVRIDVR